MESRRLREKIRVPHVDKLELRLTIRPAADMMVGERGRVRKPRKPASRKFVSIWLARGAATTHDERQRCVASRPRPSSAPPPPPGPRRRTACAGRATS